MYIVDMYICILFVVVVVAAVVVVVIVVVVVVVLYYISSNLGFQYLPVQTMLAVFWRGGPVLFLQHTIQDYR
jgi:hypothetical protein